MVRVSTFCGCFNLKIGAAIIGGIYIVGGTFAIISIILAAYENSIHDYHYKEYHLNNRKQQEYQLRIEDIHDEITLLFFMVIYIVELVFTILMIYGSYKNKQQFLTPFLSFNSIATLIKLVVSWISIVSAFINLEIAEGCLMLLTRHTYTGLFLYYWLVLHNRKEEIIRTKANKRAFLQHQRGDQKRKTFKKIRAFSKSQYLFNQQYYNLLS